MTFLKRRHKRTPLFCTHTKREEEEEEEKDFREARTNSCSFTTTQSLLRTRRASAHRIVEGREV